MQHKDFSRSILVFRNMNKWKAIPLLQYSVEFLQMHSCGQRRNGKYVADVKYGVWMAARCCIEAAGEGDGVQENLRRRLDMSGRFNVAPMATRPLPSQYDTDSMHRSYPLWACTELWVEFRRQYVCRLCLSEQYSTTVHSGLGLGSPVSPNSSIPRTILPRFREN